MEDEIHGADSRTAALAEVPKNGRCEPGARGRDSVRVCARCVALVPRAAVVYWAKAHVANLFSIGNNWDSVRPQQRHLARARPKKREENILRSTVVITLLQ
jgi:hypothetical protein